MILIISPENRGELNNYLLKLKLDSKPLWGKMCSRQMVEHLIISVEFSNGKRIATCNRPINEARNDLDLMVYGNYEIPKNVNLGPLPKKYVYSSLEISISQLMKALIDFDDYYKVYDAKAIHSGFGPMNHEEWLIWHSKHFKHHFTQFGLL